MQTRHCLQFHDAARMGGISDASVDLVVTSPPYPMIAMWDEHFSRLDPNIARLLEKEKHWQAFEGMHATLDPIWQEVARILKPGGIACINIGDAVRSLGDRFQLFSNHSRVLTRMVALGFCALPHILWRKPTNAPTKFMGSGMLPPNAYITLEHEYILVFRKGANRRFSGNDARMRRRRSAFFWEERNRWYSDVWMELRGTGQRLQTAGLRQRSAAFPIEVPLRLIWMFSTYEDTVVDPFCGTGTTLLAAMAAGRNSIGIELEPQLGRALQDGAAQIHMLAQERIRQRVADHQRFVAERRKDGFHFRHRNRPHGFAVMTGQETDLQLRLPAPVQPVPAEFPQYRVGYIDLPPDLDQTFPEPAPAAAPQPRQRTLFS